MPHLSGTEPSGHLTLQPRRDAYSVLKEMFVHSVMNSNKDFIVCFWLFFYSLLVWSFKNSSGKAQAPRVGLCCEFKLCTLFKQ